MQSRAPVASASCASHRGDADEAPASPTRSTPTSVQASRWTRRSSAAAAMPPTPTLTSSSPTAPQPDPATAVTTSASGWEMRRPPPGGKSTQLTVGIECGIY